MKKAIIIGIAAFLPLISFSQVTKDKGEFRNSKPGYFENSILKGIDEDVQQEERPKVTRSFKVNLAGKEYPKSIDEFTTWYRNNPISQGNTSTCWSFSTTSFFETEIYRLYKKEVKLSEMYTAYWEFVEKAMSFVDTRGASYFGEGSEANAVTRNFRKYGVVPFELYTGFAKGKSVYDHSKMFVEMENYLKSIKQNNQWNRDEVAATIKSIMNFYMGEPPSKVKVDGKEITPQAYLKDVLKLNMDDYLDITSLLEKPYWKKVEFAVPDNWWHDSSYYNVPLDLYMEIIKKSAKAGYTMMIGGDVSEPGFDSHNQIAFIPTFDIPSEYIDENARQFRFSNKTTTDDHGMHIIGYTEKAGKTWYLLKDSGSGSRNCGKDSKNFGYYFVHEDYIKLKLITFMVHKDMFKEYISKFN